MQDTGRRLSASDVLELADDGATANPAGRGLLLLEAALDGARPHDPAAFRLGARDAWVLDMRCATFGDELPARVSCPACGMLLSARVARERLEMPDPDGSDVRSVAVSATIGDVTVEARTPDGPALAAAAEQSDVDAARRSLVESCVVSARAGESELDPSELSDEVLEAVGDAIVAADPGAELRVDLTCAGCGHEWAPVLDPALFLWRELSASAVQILDDVHQLAIGYGWSEAETLQLSARRRRRYVERLLGG